MTSHRQISDAAFDTHLAGLSSTSLDDKINSYTTTKTDLATERTLIQAQRNQIQKHFTKVVGTLDDLSALQSFQQTLSLPASKKIYVQADAAAGGDGTVATPYASIQVAIDAKIATGQTADVIFMIAAGTYTCARTITQTFAQGVSFIGEGIGKTIIEGAVNFATGMNSDILRLTGYGPLTFEGITFRNCRYALRPSCGRLTIEDCKFIRCASSGDLDQHDNTLSKADQALRFTDASLQKASNGGSIRCDTATGPVRITRNIVKHCLRGIRVTNAIAGGVIADNFVRDTLESGIYLSIGCSDVVVQSNKILNPANNGILVIGTRFCKVLHNSICESWNTGIQSWFSSELTIQGNAIRDCAFSTFNGIGNDGDSWASGICLDGVTNIPADCEFQSKITGNSIIQLHDGRAGQKIALRIKNTPFPYGDINLVGGNRVGTVDTAVLIDAGANKTDLSEF